MEEFERIRKLYVDKKMSGKDIADELGYLAPQSIYNKLEKMGIDRRGMRECQKPFQISKNELIRLYYDEDLSTREISNKFDMNAETIRRRMIEYGIERKDKTRNFGGWNKGLTKENNESIKKQAKELSETRKRMFDNNELKHWNEGRKWSEEVKDKISNTLKGKLTKEKNPNWKGGYFNTEIGLERARLNGTRDYDKWRKYVFERDNYACQLCGKESEGDIQAHHIVPMKNNLSLCLDKKNGITLCESCHIHRVNNHEYEYKDYFEMKVKENEKT